MSARSPAASAEENGVAPQAPGGNEVQAAPQSTARPTVSGDAGLAALDRNMAIEYGRAAAVATPEQRDQLRQTALRFTAYRDRCPNRQCIADAYAGRIREIRDIVEGRWQPPR